MQPDLIFDIGLHKGEDTEFYLKKGFRVVAVEANPELCTLVKDRLKQYVDSGHLTVLNIAIADKEGPIKFYINDRLSEWGTTVEEWKKAFEANGSSSIEITVPGRTMRSLLEEYGVPYYLKIDIEGSDFICLQGLKDCPSKPKYLSFESRRTVWKQLLEEFALLKELGYSKFQAIQQLDVKKQKCPSPAKEGKFVEHNFERGAAGLFGAELPGPWLSEEKVLARYRNILLTYQLYNDEAVFRKTFIGRVVRRLLDLQVGWYDTHCTFDSGK